MCGVAQKSNRTPAKRKRRGKGRGGAPLRRLFRWLWKWARRGAVALCLIAVPLTLIPTFVAPPVTPYMLTESYRLGGIRRAWVAIDDLPLHVPAAMVAAEDANFCLHWGFDMSAIRAAIADGARRGGSTISQQTTKNVYLWQGRSWFRKLLEAGLTPLVELFWTKRRILEVYLNVAEFGEGVFGIEAAAEHAFGTPAAGLSALQAARLAAVLPSPKTRSASAPTPFVRRRARAILDGAETIRIDGRADCFGG